MNAHDIFKRLTKGARFKREDRPQTQNQKCNEPAPLEKAIDRNSADEARTFKQENGELAEERKKSHTITLLGSMSVSDGTKRGKKRKALEVISEDRKQEMLHTEMVNHLRKQSRIKVVGRHVPEPIDTFEELPIDDDLKDNLKGCGYTEPTAIQKQAIPIMLQGRRMLACAPTGSGKTAAFLLPIVHTLQGPKQEGFRALILCPTRELAKQTQKECLRLSEGRQLRIHIISKIQRALTQYGPKSSQKFDILITTPLRLCYLLKQDPPAIILNNVQWLIVDEADKLFELGVNSFRLQLKRILAACDNAKLKIAMFSATYTPDVARWCLRRMKGLIRVTVGQRNAATELVDQELLFVGSESGKLLAFRDIVRKGITPPVLVFVQSKERAQQLYSELMYDGINIDVIHADKTQLQRDETVRSFRKGSTWVLICTELMARGIDFKGVNLVINYDFPTSAISYVHRVGRAGRAGRRGKAITFFTVDDTVNLRSIASVIKQSGCDVPDYMLKMKKRSKREVKKLKASAPQREDITTTPRYELEKKMKRRRRNENLKMTGKKNVLNKKKTTLKKPKPMS